eukprot:4765507-Prymnesium_polylepis.2
MPLATARAHSSHHHTTLPLPAGAPSSDAGRRTSRSWTSISQVSSATAKRRRSSSKPIRSVRASLSCRGAYAPLVAACCAHRASGRPECRARLGSLAIVRGVRTRPAHTRARARTFSVRL